MDNDRDVSAPGTTGDLISRLEALEGPSIDVDADIARVLGWTLQKMERDRKPYWRRPGEMQWFARSELPKFTDSVLQALDVVPQGWWWRIGECSVSCDATVGPDRAHVPEPMLSQFDDGFDGDVRQPSTPAIALCIAALKARAAIERSPVVNLPE